jgi:hypothetical protein
MANFATVDDIATFLQVDISSAQQIAAAERALTEVTAAIRNYVDQYIELVEDDEITLDSIGGTRIFLPQLPVISIASVVEDGVELTVNDDYKLGQHGILHRIGRKWARGIQLLTITYTHGYEALPDDIVAVATRAASRAYQSGLTAAEEEGAMGVQGKSLGDFSVQYGAESVVEGRLGASGARLLLMSEKDILDQYKV